MTLENDLVRFTRGLRQLGVRVGSGEMLDAVEALQLVDLADKNLVKNALRSTLVKDHEGYVIFERAFASFFAPPEEKKAREQERAVREQEQIQRRRQAEQDLPANLSQQQKDTYGRLPEAEKQKLLEYVQHSLEQGGANPRFPLTIESVVRGYLNYWRRQLTDPVEVDFTPTGDNELDAMVEQVMAGLGSVDDPIMFQDLKDIPDKDLPRVTALIRKLSRRLATRISRRYHRSRRTRLIDLRRSIRENIRHGGAMLQLRYKTRRVQKPRLLLICDVSGSMARYASFVLQFIYGVSSVVKGIESFIFAEDLERVTQFFGARRGFEETMLEVISCSSEWGEGTNLAAALSTLFRRYSSLLTPDTVVIVLSDTKTMAVEGAAERLAQMRRSVKEILWLNTLPKAQWAGSGSVAAFSGQSEMFECNTLAHLEKVMRTHLLKMS